jgi:hypothetical protein
MTKNPIKLSLIIFAFTAFAAICFYLWMKRGKHKKAVSLKMRLGAFLISALGIVNTGCPVVNCYDVPDYDMMYLNTIYYDTVHVDYPTNNDLYGEISNRKSDQFSFAITSLNNSTVFQLEDIQAADGKMDDNYESFNLSIDSIPSGNYRLQLLLGPASAYPENTYLKQDYNLKITND